MTSQKTFVSYAREDSAFALKLARGLRSAGVDIWIDQLDIPAGVHWDRAVEEALRNCGRFLVILSPESVASTNVMDEVSYAIEHHKQVIPVLRKNCEIPLRLRRVQYIDFTAGYGAALKNLIASVGPSQPAAFPGAGAQVRAAKRKWYQRMFLLYAPSGGAAWILHIVFYWSLLVTVIAPLSILAEGDATSALIVAVIWLFFLAGLGWLGWLIDSTGGTPRPRTKLQRALLLYWPAGVSARALHVLFYALVLIVVAGLIGTAVDWRSDPQSGELLIGALTGAALVALIRGVARRIDRAASGGSDALPDPPSAQAATAK